MKNNMLLDRMKKDLGTKTTEIATKLRARKITGSPQDGDSCPIANYFKTIGADDVMADHENIEVTYRFATPAAFAKFIEKFDDAQYPELINADERHYYEEDED